MNAAPELSLLAELGAAFAGFIAIFLIFARREGRFSPADSLRIESIILASFAAVFFSLFPLVLYHSGFPDGTTWRVASAVALLAGLAAGGVVARRHLALSPEDRAEVGVWHAVVTWSLFTLAAVFLASNLFAVFHDPTAWPYLATLVCVLAIAAANFVTIAFQRLL